MSRAVERILVIATLMYFIGVAVLFVVDYFPERTFAPQNAVPPVTAAPPLSNAPVEEPVRVRIPAIDVDAVVQQAGLTSKGNIGIPTNYHDVAWFTGSPKPGEQGNSVVVGHRDTRVFAPGVFRHLKDLQVGDRVYVDTNGGTLEFRVVDKRTYYENTDRLAEIVGYTSKTRLNLITCDGTWNQAVRRYDQRVVVFTELVE